MVTPIKRPFSFVFLQHMHATVLQICDFGLARVVEAPDATDAKKNDGEEESEDVEETKDDAGEEVENDTHDEARVKNKTDARVGSMRKTKK